MGYRIVSPTQIKDLEKTIDYEERAKHDVELPLLKQQKKVEEAKQFQAWQEHHRTREDAQRAEHTKLCQLKTRLAPIAPHFTAFVNELKTRRQTEFAAKTEAYQLELAAFKQVGLVVVLTFDCHF